ncbi:hypothetical protein ACIBG6_05295 [Streptomyces sp. NPDC050842]|uniref:hypothetical protein n=1 Tax=Streptomyces sp. NPDC050842 TaxID=3365636 RepID=UPI0037BD8607
MQPPGTPSGSAEDDVQIYRLLWTRAGRDERQVSTVSYDAKSAEYYKARTAAADGVSDVEIVPVEPGRQPTWPVVVSGGS